MKAGKGTEARAPSDARVGLLLAFLGSQESLPYVSLLINMAI